jgi:6-phosphogluconolactonase
MAESRVLKFATPEEVSRQAAEWLTALAEQTPGRFTISLSGGSTPKALYQLLAAEPFRSRMPWQRVNFFFGDERFVPHTDQDSNFRMVKEALFDHVDIPAANIYPIPGEGDPNTAAATYQAQMQAYYGSQALDAARPFFDVILMGLGEDGHTASLFPGNPALEETMAWAVAVSDPSVSQARITLTYPVFDSSRVVAFLAEGSKKSTPLRRVLAGDRSAPAARVKSMGEVLWFVDKAAADDKG